MVSNVTATEVFGETRFDAFRRATVSVDGCGNATTRTYDAMGRQMQAIEAAGVATFLYDDFGAVTNETVIGVAGTNVIERFYDEYGRNAGYALNGVRQTTIAYDPATGRLVSMSVPTGEEESNHSTPTPSTYTSFIYVPGPEKIGDEEILRRINALYREAMGEVLAEREREKEEREAKGRDASSVRGDPPRSKADSGLETPKVFPVELERGNLAVAERILELLADGPMRPSALRKAVGIRSSIHFNRYYLSPLLKKGMIARTDPDHPQSPQQRYCLR